MAGESSSSKNYPTECTQVLKGHDGVVLKVMFNGDGSYCLSGGQDKTLRLWNPHRNMLLKTYRGHGHEVYDVDVSPDNSRIFSCGGDRVAVEWDVATGRIIRKLRGHTQKVNACALNDEATVLVTGSYDATVRVWDLKSRSYAPMDIFEHAKDSITSLIISTPDIITASVDGCVRTYDVRMGKVRTDTFAHPVTCVSLSHDKKCLLVGTMGDETVRLIDKSTGDCLATYKGHKNTQYRLDTTLSYDDAMALACSEDSSIVMWDLVEATIIKTLKGHVGAVDTLCYHPKQHCIASGGFDGTIRIWE